MKTQTKYIILTLGITAFGLLIFNKYNAFSVYSIIPALEYSKIFFGIGILSAGIYYFYKKWRKGLTKMMMGVFGLCLILNLYLVTEYYKAVQIQNTIAEYDELQTCEEMEKRFAADLKDEEIKYFQFGIATDMELQNTLKTDYGIESFGMGCIMDSEMICYNKLVEAYIEKEYGKSINDL